MINTEFFPTIAIVTFAVCLLGSVLNLLLFLKKRVIKPCAQATIAKGTTSFFFVLAWFVLASRHMTPFSSCVGIGLVCGMLGDIALDLKYCCPEDEDTYTRTGFGAFAVGHIFYISAVVTGSVHNGEYVIPYIPAIIAVVIGILVGLVIFFGEKAMKLHYGKYKIISTLYGGLLFAMASYALISAFYCGVKENINLLVMGIGGLMFAVSDLILSGTYFGEGKNRPVDVITNHVTYYLAQYLMAASVLFYQK